MRLVVLPSPTMVDDDVATARQARQQRRWTIGSIVALHPIRRMFGESRGTTWAVMFFIVVMSLMLVRPLAMSLLSWHRTAGLLAERRSEVVDLQQRRAVLLEQHEYYETDDFIAERARTYGLAPPGEVTFVIRELVHPESAARYATSKLRNATQLPAQPKG